MTAEAMLNRWLQEYYVGRRPPGLSYDPTPFTVAHVHYDQDCDCVNVCFWSVEKRHAGYPIVRYFSMDEDLPEVLT